VTNPQNSFATNFGRFYAHPSAGLDKPENMNLNTDPFGIYSPKPSVTNVIGMMDKRFLPPFYAKVVAEYAIANLDALAAVVGKFGPSVAIGTLKAIPNRRHEASAVGDEVHSAIEAWCKDSANVPEFSTTTAAAMYHQWLYFTSQFSFEVVRTEFTVWSYAHGYAGTGDLLFKTEEGLWLVDAKTGKGVYPEVALQTSALAHADVILDVNGDEADMPATDIQGVVHVRPRSVKLHKLGRTGEAFDVFLSCKRIFDWRRFDAENVLQEPVRTECPKAGK
jgi:hypothetical protein